jgi:pimeloyl-ACP methyl ester carboxylesterase
MQHVVVNGVRIACEVAGQGPGLLLLHGLGGSRDDWRRQVPEFCRYFRVVAPDLRGFGGSERQEPYTIQQHARDADALLQALGLPRAHVLGLSMGGAIAMELALTRPERVASLVLANTAPSFELRGWQRRYMGLSRLLLASLFGVGGVARMFGKAVFPAPHQEQLRRRLMQRASHTSRWVYIASIRSLVRWNAEDRLGSIASPTLVIGAEHDYTDIHEKRRWAALIPGARVIMLPGSRHRSELDAPEAFNEAVLRFLGPPQGE